MPSNRRALLGVLLVLIGLVLLLRNLGYIPELPGYLFSWPALFILIAIINLIQGNRSGALLFGCIGGFFILRRYVDIDFQVFWPLIIVIVGLAIIFRKRSSAGSAVNSKNFFDDLNVFGGSSVTYTSQSLEGGIITNVFGGSEIDLREAKPLNGAQIKVFTVFGGCTLIVPSSWDVKIDTTSIFGGFEDNRDRSIPRGAQALTVRGISIFGGGEIKSV